MGGQEHPEPLRALGRSWVVIERIRILYAACRGRLDRKLDGGVCSIRDVIAEPAQVRIPWRRYRENYLVLAGVKESARLLRWSHFIPDRNWALNDPSGLGPALVNPCLKRTTITAADTAAFEQNTT